MEIKELRLNNKKYPKLLASIKNKPKILYYLGSLRALEAPTVAIVGTRRASEYGKEVVKKISNELAQAGITIVSGMALGIDTFAHQGAIETGGKTIAVLGSSMEDRFVYPQQNVLLMHNIIKTGGLIFSEYKEKHLARKYDFIKRNRIVSGLSLATLVADAPIKSGAMITARLTSDEKRKVFAVPGSIFSANSALPHYLIKKRIAHLAEKAEDILELLNLDNLFSFKNKQKQKNLLSQKEQVIVRILKINNCSLDELIEKSKMPINELAIIITDLELKKIIKNINGSYIIC